jgi:hypothetical protein
MRRDNKNTRGPAGFQRKLGTSFYGEEKEKTTDMSSSSDPAPNPSKQDKKPVKKLQNTLGTQP